MINHHSFKIRVKLSLTQINIHQTQALSPTIKKIMTSAPLFARWTLQWLDQVVKRFQRSMSYDCREGVGEQIEISNLNIS